MQRFQWKLFLRQVAVIAIPIALQNLLTTTGSMVDTMMIASLGELTVGAVGLCAQFSSLMFSCYWGFVGGGLLFFSQYWGAKDHDGINSAYGLDLICILSVGVIFCLLGTCFPEQVMRLYTDKPAIQEIGVRYLRIAGFAYPLQSFSMAMSTLYRGTEQVRIPLVSAVCSVITNCVLNYILIFGHFGAPVMGAEGAAAATVAAGFVNCAVLLIAGKIKRYPYLLEFNRHFKWRKGLVSTFFIKSAPILANELLIGVGNMVINIVLGRQSEQAIAAIAVFRMLEGFIIGFFAGFSNAGSILVGKEVGAGNPETAYQRAIRLIYLCMAFIAAAGLFLLAVNDPLLHAMSLHDESYRIGVGVLSIFCAVAVIRMGNWCQNDTYRSAGDAAYGTILEIVFMYAMLLPMVWLTGMVWKAPFLLVFACCYIDEPIRFVLMQWHMYKGTWIKPVTAEGIAAMPAFREKHHIRVRKQAA